MTFESLSGYGRFRLVITTGTRIHGRILKAAYREVPASVTGFRVGVSVSKRFGNAVKRNRIKRLVREAIRFCRDDLRGLHGGGSNVVEVVFQLTALPAPDACRVTLQDIEEDLRLIIRKMKARSRGA